MRYATSVTLQWRSVCLLGSPSYKVHEDKESESGMASRAVLEAVWVERARTLAFFVLAVLVAALIGLVWTSPAHATTFTVNSTGDGADAEIANSICDSDAGTPGDQCTLRAAIQEANTNNDEPTVDLIN